MHIKGPGGLRGGAGLAFFESGWMYSGSISGGLDSLSLKGFGTVTLAAPFPENAAASSSSWTTHTFVMTTTHISNVYKATRQTPNQQKCGYHRTQLGYKFGNRLLFCTKTRDIVAIWQKTRVIWKGLTFFLLKYTLCSRDLIMSSSSGRYARILVMRLSTYCKSIKKQSGNERKSDAIQRLL